MQIGAMNHPARDPVQEIEWIGQNEFDFVDFTCEPPAAGPERIDPGKVRAALERHELHVVAHTAYYLPISSPFRWCPAGSPGRVPAVAEGGECHRCVSDEYPLSETAALLLV